MPEIPEAVTQAVEKFGQDIFDKAGQTAVGQYVKGSALGKLTSKLWNNRNMEVGMSRTPAGANLYKILKEDYEPAVSKAEQQLQSKYSNIKLGQQGPVMPSDVIANQARNIARVSAFGRNDALAVQHIKWAYQTHGKLAAQSLADHVHVYLADTVEKENTNLVQMGQRSFISRVLKPGTMGAGSEDVSLFKYNVKMSRENQVPIKIGARYSKPGEVENWAYKTSYVTMLSDLAVKHIGTPFNVIFGTPLSGLAKALTEVASPGGYRSTRNALLDTGIFGSTALEIFRSDEAASAARFGPQLYKIMHAPFFNAERKWTIAFAGAAGKHSAEYYANELIQNPTNRRNIFALKEMGIEPRDVIKQGGKLTQEQTNKAIYRFVDDRVFLNRKLNKSYLGLSNPIMRVGTMYHGYTSAQGRLLRREFMRMWKTGDIGTIVQTLTTLGVIFPAVGHVVGGLERLVRGQSFNDPKYSEESLVHKYIDDMSHMAGFGMSASYVNAALRERLANQIIGPVGNVAVQTGTDSLMALAGSKSWKVPARDILYYSFPDNLGKIMAHQLLPTTAEERAKHHHLKKMRSFKLKGLKK